MSSLDDFHPDDTGFSTTFSIDYRDIPVRLIGKDKAAFAFFDQNVVLELIDRAPGLIAPEMLDLKNTQWLEEGEQSLDKLQFIRKLKLDSVHVNPDKTIRIYYHDGGLFWGHAVVAEFDAEGKMKYATIEG